MQFHNPPFRATVLLEMRKKNNDFVIEIFYKNSSSEPTQLDIPNCGMSCPLSKMYELYNDVLPVDWESECRLSLLMPSLMQNDIQSTFGNYKLKRIVF